MSVLAKDLTPAWERRGLCGAVSCRGCRVGSMPRRAQTSSDYKKLGVSGRLRLLTDRTAPRLNKAAVN